MKAKYLHTHKINKKSSLINKERLTDIDIMKRQNGIYIRELTCMIMGAC